MPATQRSQDWLTDDSYAIVIGIARYEHVRALPEVDDAKDVALALVKHCGYKDDNVCLIQDQQATRERIMSELGKIADSSDQKVTVFLFFTGHGVRIKGQGEYLLPVDARAADNMGEISVEELSRSAISSQQFEDVLNKIGTERLFVVLDCCHAGSIGTPKALQPGLSTTSYEQIAGAKGCVLLASCGEDQSSYIPKGASHSLFTSHFLTGLRGGAASLYGKVYATVLYNYVRRRVAREHPSQTPWFSGRFDEDLPIARVHPRYLRIFLLLCIPVMAIAILYWCVDSVASGANKAATKLFDESPNSPKDISDVVETLSKPWHRWRAIKVIREASKVGIDPSSNGLETPGEDRRRIFRGQCLADAAIVALRLGETAASMEFLTFIGKRRDPEAFTQFIHRCRKYGVNATTLFEALQESMQASDDLDWPVGAVSIWEARCFACLMSLGEFDPDEISFDDPSKYISELYRNTRSSTVHTGARWLLESWGGDREIDESKVLSLEDLHQKISTSHFSNPSCDEWFVLDLTIGSRRELVTFYLVNLEINRHDTRERVIDETSQNGALFAVSDSEVTNGQFIALYDWDTIDEAASQCSQLTRQHAYELHDRKEKHSPGRRVGFTPWHSVVDYCRALSERCGITENQQCLSPNPDSDESTWRLQRLNLGFRVPTAVEWKAACGANTDTGFWFGSDASLLGKHLASSLEHGRTSMPNMLGLRGVHGGVREWCCRTQAGTSIVPVLAGGCSAVENAKDVSDYSLDVEWSVPANNTYEHNGFRLCLSISPISE